MTMLKESGRTVAFALGEALRNARMASLTWRAKSRTAEALVEVLYSLTLEYEAHTLPRQRQRSEAQRESLQRTIGAFVRDLLRARLNVEAGGYCYRPSHPSWFEGTQATSRQFSKLVRWWPAMGLIERTGAQHIAEEADGDWALQPGRARRYKATAQLLALAEEAGVTPQNVDQFFREYPNTARAVILKAANPSNWHDGRKGRRMRLPAGPEREQNMLRMIALNSAAQLQTYSFGEPPHLVRIFNNGDRPGFAYQWGGRIYCLDKDGYQQMPKAQRRRIRINGERTVEVDVKASQLTVLYGFLGESLDLSEDPYAVDLSPVVNRDHLPPGDAARKALYRDIVKGIIVAAIGTGGMGKSWPHRLSDDLAAKHGLRPSALCRYKDAAPLVFGRHPILWRLKPNVLDWAVLQYEESEAILAALDLIQVRHGILALPVHDSLIVPRRLEEETKEALRQAYRERLSIVPVFGGTGTGG